MRVKSFNKIICYIVVFVLTITGLSGFSKSGYIVSRAASTYNAQAAIAYALKYAENYNPAYASYTGVDCSNFVSQCLTAGGLPHDTYWNPNCPVDPKTGYNNWRSTALKDYLIYKGYEVIWNPAPEQIIPGNPVFYSYNSNYAITHEGTVHAAICVSNTKGNNPMIAEHSHDHASFPHANMMKSFKGCCTILLTHGGNSLITLWGMENNLEITAKTKLWAKRTDNDSNHYAVFYVDGEAITGHLSADQSGFFAVEIDPQKYADGAHTFSVYYANTNGSKTDSRTIIINKNPGQSPQGCLDSISGGYGTVSLSGWTFDRDALSENLVCDVWAGHGSADTKIGSFTANSSRPDVDTAYPGVGRNHGFSSTLNVSITGNYDIYLYALSVGGGADKLIDHKSVNIKPKSSTACITDGEYYISSAVDSSYFVTSNGVSEDEENVYLSKQSKQKFKFTYLSDGYYRISAGTNEKVLDVYEAKTVNGTNINLFGWYEGNDNRKWMAKKNSDGTFTFVNKCNGLVMEVNGAYAVEGANIDVWQDNGANNTKWKLTSCDKKVTGISLNYTSHSMFVDEKITLVATVSPSDATNKQVKWSSSNTAVATVDDSGKVTGVSAGTATITATARDGSGIFKSCTVTVSDIEACEHNEVIDEAVPATCTKEGKTVGKHCSKCNEVLVEQKTVEALGHEEVVDRAVAATCTESGLTAGKHCSRCAKVLVVQQQVEALGHEEVIDNAETATCTKPGLTAGKHCSRCNKILAVQKEVEALGHEEVVDKAVTATCTMDGKTEGKHCSRCGKVFVKQKEVKATGHTYDQKVVSSKTLKSGASYDSPAIYYYSCSCGAVGTDTFTSGTALEKPQNPKEPKDPEPLENSTPDVSVSYHTHIQSFGDLQGVMKDGEMAGTSGMAKRLENIWLKVDGNANLGIQYSTHCQTYGWLPWSTNGEANGTSGEAKRLEAIKIQLTGADASKYDVYYRVHAQSYGWLGWAKNGEPSGTAGYGKRLEGIQVVVKKKGEAAPGLNYAGINAASLTHKSESYVAKTQSTVVIPGNTDAPNVMYKTHVQSFGWQKWMTNGQMSGTSGKAKRLEGINIKLSNCPYSGGIRYMTHIQKYGWSQGWKANGVMAGTSGEAKRLEAIRIELTGEMAKHYDVYYRVHAQSYGWLGWAKNGQESGTAGLAKRLEGIQIVLVPKGQVAPGITYKDITSVKTQAYIKK